MKRAGFLDDHGRGDRDDSRLRPATGGHGRSPCVRPSNAPLSAAVEALVGGGHVTTAVHDALGGVLPLVGDYIITRYGAWDMPCALELLRKHDGRTVQSITHFGVLTPPGR